MPVILQTCVATPKLIFQKHGKIVWLCAQNTILAFSNKSVMYVESLNIFNTKKKGVFPFYFGLFLLTVQKLLGLPTPNLARLITTPGWLSRWVSDIMTLSHST